MIRPARTFISESARTRAATEESNEALPLAARRREELPLRQLRLLLDERREDRDRVRLAELDHELLGERVARPLRRSFSISCGATRGARQAVLAAVLRELVVDLRENALPRNPSAYVEGRLWRPQVRVRVAARRT